MFACSEQWYALLMPPSCSAWLEAPGAMFPVSID
jgi:hypothetical protein